MKTMPFSFTELTIRKCARCGGTHTNLTFLPFTHACGKLTHYAPCPKNHEPILMRFVQDRTTKKPKCAVTP